MKKQKYTQEEEEKIAGSNGTEINIHKAPSWFLNEAFRVAVKAKLSNNTYTSKKCSPSLVIT